ncbi:MAG: hypothetical protein CME32_08170 [Gimesia sp.]|jgi:hypothetical protein|nr:hypothetical protein [Gimesia sp.]
MKFWYGYGSEHSANIVMIGEFKTIEGADKVNEIITKISEQASSDYSDGVINDWGTNEQFSEETEKLLKDLKIYISPSDMADFALLDPRIKKSDNKLIITTDNDGVGGFIKLMIKNGAKVQIYSNDDYPETEQT